MKALVKPKPEPGLELIDQPIPSPGPSDILVKIHASAICGSDIKIKRWDPVMQNLIRTLPVIPGHECAGEVVEVGNNVSKVKTGDRVAAETHIPCGKCNQCLRGRLHTCDNMQLFGHTIDGCFADYALFPESATWKLPVELSYDLGCLLEPMGIPYRAVERAKIYNEPVVVLGCGPIGQFAIAFSHLQTAKPLIAVDTNPLRLNIAKQMGADFCLNPHDVQVTESIRDITSSSRNVAVIIEASGNVKAFQELLPTLRAGGKAMVLGQSKDNLLLSVSPDIVLRELELVGFYGRLLWDTWEKTQDILQNGLIDVTPVITNRYRLADFNKAFQEAEMGNGCKVLFVSD